MRIVNIILTKDDGGVAKVSLDYANIFKSLGHQTSFITKKNSSFVNKIEKIGVNLNEVNNRFGYFDLIAIKQIAKHLKKLDADLVVAHNSKAIALSKKAIKKLKKKPKLIAINHSTNVKRSIGANLILNVNKEIFYKTVDLGQPYDHSFVVYNGLDFAKDFTQSKINLLNKKEIVLGVIGRIDIYKNFSAVINALKILNEKTSQKFVIKIAGTGEEEQNLRKLAENLKINDQVEFLGWIEDGYKFYQEIDIFVLPTLRETFGLVILEAIKHRKPIIATRTVGPSEILRHEKDGLLINIEPKEQMPDRIAKAVIKLVNNHHLVNDLVNNSYQRALDHFSTEILKQKLADILDMVKK